MRGGGVSDDRRSGRHVFGNNRAGADHCAFANRHAAKNCGAAADTRVPLYDGGNHQPVTRGLPGSISIGGAWNLVINKSDAVSNEDFVFDRHTFADETMTRDFAVAPDTCPLLDFDECSNAGAVADFAAVKIYKMIDDHIAPEFYVRRDNTELSWHRLREDQYS